MLGIYHILLILVTFEFIPSHQAMLNITWLDNHRTAGVQSATAALGWGRIQGNGRLHQNRTPGEHSRHLHNRRVDKTDQPVHLGVDRPRKHHNLNCWLTPTCLRTTTLETKTKTEERSIEEQVMVDQELHEVNADIGGDDLIFTEPLSVNSGSSHARCTAFMQSIDNRLSAMAPGANPNPGHGQQSNQPTTSGNPNSSASTSTNTSSLQFKWQTRLLQRRTLNTANHPIPTSEESQPPITRGNAISGYWRLMTQSLGGPDKVLQVNVTQQEAAQFDTIWANSHGTADCCDMLALGTNPPAAVLVRHLASELSQQNLTEAERESKRKKDMKESRKVTLWESRRNLTFDVPELEGQRAALDSLGIDAMSSDEELQDLSMGRVIYQIKPPAWRALFVTNWLRFFDKMSPVNMQPLPEMPDFYKHDEAYVAMMLTVSSSIPV
ncbi:hypothetical protein IW261DRAFT_1426349 [Armillaria novae-zelandiae]|uniref:Uncharacterized protein n=1 Tax=Armillaria novae-zelandiae TaxID=153914 RepID=A0AA39T6T0_9AGAR|nr:hypothetical protein IW261DRAFT_1426349 [Armillaria novae-zelandiae]